MAKCISGMIAAPITPVDASGRANLPAFERLVEYLLQGGMEGICVGGATGEFPHFETAARKELVTAGARAVRGRGRFVVAVGAPTFRGVVEMAGHALAEGAEALLLPAPYFFRYEQDDLAEYCRRACREAGADFLLYNLPQFANPYTLETVIRLLENEERIVGIKDSSGDRGSLEPLVRARKGRGWALMVGNDGLLLEAMRAGWDGVISGGCNLCPELYAALFRSLRGGDSEAASLCMAGIDELRIQTAPIPFPWAIRAGVAMRGLPTGDCLHPLSEARSRQIDAFREWFRHWLGESLPVLLERVPRL